MTLALPVVLMALVLSPAQGPQTEAVSLTARSIAPWLAGPSQVSVHSRTDVARPATNPFPRGSTGNFRGVRATRATAVIVGTIIGLVAGGLTGGALDADCTCDSPGMAGFLVGAPVGGVVGALVTFHLTR